MEKSSIKSWNYPWISPQTVTGVYTGYTLDSFDKTSFTFSHKTLICLSVNNSHLYKLSIQLSISKLSFNIIID